MGNLFWLLRAAEANQKAQALIAKGVEAIQFVVDTSVIDWKLLFKDLPLDKLTIYVKLFAPTKSLVNELSNFMKTNNGSLILQIGVLENLAKTGQWLASKKKTMV